MKTQATLDDLVDQVGNLTSATTDLLNATNLGKVNLDSAVSEAQGHAQSAELASTSAVNAKEVAISKAAEAKTAADNATAIVHNDEGSLTSKSGAYPVADSKGHLDINWTPLLAAMYPYSGVIGSVDKEDLFRFAQYEPDANSLFWIYNQDQCFNIAGRFVKRTQIGGGWDTAKITLPEAESTAARAIAFDDIFLDWNGTVTTYRSITPHRTTTGYDRDKIATEHGYSKIQKGLYKTGDTYALLLGRVARRNQGGYHPVFNPEGSSKWYETKINGTTWGSYPWYGHQITYDASTIEDAFNFKNANVDQEEKPAVNLFTGRIEAKHSARSDNKFYDAIYADDFTPLYYSAKSVIDRQALLFDSFNRAVAGETFSAAEDIKYSTAKVVLTEQVGESNSWIYRIHLDRIPTDLEPSTTPNENLMIHNGRVSSESHFLWYNDTQGNIDIYTESIDIVAGDTVWFTVPSGRLASLVPFKSSARPQFLMVDIIGAPEAWPDEWKKHGLPGNLLAVGEEGESLIPDGTQKQFKASRKVLDCYQVLETSDKGVTWYDRSQFTSHFQSASNALSHNPDASTCYMVFYRTSANPFELADNTTWLDTENTGVHFCQRVTEMVYNYNLIGKVVKGNSNNYESYMTPVRKLCLMSGYNSLYEGPQYPIKFEPYNGIIRAGYAPTVSLAYLTNRSNQSTYEMQIIANELKEKNKNFGNDGTLVVVDKQSTITDLNGMETVATQKRVELPYHFDGITY